MASKPARSPAAQAFTTLVHDLHHVSMVEMERALHPFMDTQGTQWWEILPNVGVWFNMSQAWIDVMHELQDANQVVMMPVDPAVYLIEGGGWSRSFPLAQNIPKNGYTKPHWMPVCWNPLHLAQAELAAMQPATPRRRKPPRPPKP